MKNLFCIITLLVLFSSCKKPIEYPRYTLEGIQYVPDSLKQEQQKWITETVRAASQHMTGGDYEDVYKTIIKAEQASERLFSRKVVGLRKELNEHYFDDLSLKPWELSVEEKHILDSLLKTNSKP